MTLVTYRPVQDFAHAQTALSRLMQGTGRGLDVQRTGIGFAPAIDIVAKGEDLILFADLPGFDLSAIDVSIEGRTLSLSGERRPPAEFSEGEVYRSEREQGRFSRTFELPVTVDRTGITAEFADGVLRVTIPKVVEARPQKIEVTTA